MASAQGIFERRAGALSRRRPANDGKAPLLYLTGVGSLRIRTACR